MPTLSRPAPASHPSATSIPSFENAVLEDVLNKNNPGRQRAFTANSATRDVTHGTNHGIQSRQTSPESLPETYTPPANSDLNMELLKHYYTTYFGPRAMAGDWIPMLLSSPAAFLASLSVSAPYTDLMATSQSSTRPVTDQDHLQTLEIIDNLPRILNESLSNPAEGYSDANIAAVLQFLCGQLSTDHHAMAPIHQAFLKHMVVTRGGLEHIGESGVIPVHLSITDLEANFLRNEDADLLYLSFAEKYAGDASETTRSTLESPVFSRDPSLKAVASSPMCSIPTHRLLYLSLQLTERFLQLDRMKDIASTDVGSTAGEFGKDELEKIIYKISIDIHGLPASSTPGHRGYNDSVYESIRLATLLYCHAILHQVPVHKASGLRCMLDHGAGCMSNPDLIQQAICKTNLSDAWDRMAGVLYWVLLVAGAACHKDVKITASEHDLKAAVTRSQGQQRLSRAPSAGIKSEPPWSDNAFVQSQAFSTPESSGRIFQQYLSAQHLDTAKLATPPSFPGSQPTSRTQSPLPTHPHVGMQAPSMPHSKTTAVRSSSSSTPAPVSPRVEPSLAKLGKRVRTSSPPGLNEINHQISTADSINNSNQAEDKTFVRNFLVANAIRCSILLRFEHTGAVVGSIAKLGRVRNALNRDNHR